jgi:ribonuclease D
MQGNTTTAYTFINTTEQLNEVCHQLNEQDWIGFDTEFIGEKRYFTLLCLIQVDCPLGSFLIDPIAIDDLAPFLKVLENPSVCKITHAGENDYRILFNKYNILPKNVFDTQIAAGFLGYNYPTAFRKIVEKELKIRLKKGFAVAEWDTRPLGTKHLQYALNDVIYLEELYKRLTKRLESTERAAWCQEEMDKLETAAYYYINPNAEALNNNMMPHLNLKEQIFMLRLFSWRKSEAKNKDYSKEMVLQGKYINQIVKNIQQGPAALKNNRLLPKSFFKKYGQLLVDLYDQAPTEEEKET